MKVESLGTGQALSPSSTEPSAAKRAGPNDELRRAAVEFEGIFVRQLLRSSGIEGKAGDQGYGSMVVDALAGGIESGGGLGLARRIEEVLAQIERTEKKSP